MSDLNREQFEKWFDESGFYKFKETAWAAWEASRECLVIEPEWPDHYSYTNPDCAGAAILDCRSAFNVSARAAGVKTK